MSPGRVSVAGGFLTASAVATTPGGVFGTGKTTQSLAAMLKCGQAMLIAAVVLGTLLAATYGTAVLLYDAVPEARQMSGNISSHLDLGHIQRGLSAMKTFVYPVYPACLPACLPPSATIATIIFANTPH